MRDGAVARVAAEPDVLVAGLDAPRAPQRRVLVEGGAGGGVLAWETRDLRRDGLFLAVEGGCDGESGVFPPVELGDVGEAAAAEPGFQAEADEELHVGVVFLDLEDGRVR